MNDFQNKTVFITGAAKGQGRGAALAFAKEGANTIAFNRGDIKKLEELKKEINEIGGEIEIFSGDVTNSNDIKFAVDKGIKIFGKIDILFNNAGICKYGLSHELTEEEWDSTMNINLKGAWLTSKYIIPHFIRQKSGVIVNNSSIAGLEGMGKLSHYSASKFGMVGLTKSQAIELAPYNIRVVSIHPAGVNTTMKLDMAEQDGTTLEEIARNKVNLLEAPWVEVADVVNMVLFLASDKARYITGSQFVIDAGRVSKQI
ncbi:3-ketoacyl-ACP reductase [Clostridium gelidum]|uniref:3-ketoacyl-ACP reductase n=1 Tax=Clostridium gelidum TaxID=704125 RepID=A0ABN6IUI9_9CLOT|nr:SDR family NAD(P)-dependent oxidoreductase [Clostridium gelidum]BCZ44543.1 3-ketoacyl-ACP reductase [Clostridium gelidum]